MQIKKALLSVSDKTGIVELAKKLKEHNVELIKTTMFTKNSQRTQ